MLRKVLLSVVAVAAMTTVFSTTAVNAEWPVPPPPPPAVPQKPEVPKPPIDVVKSGSGAWTWKVKGTGSVQLYDVLTTYANSSGVKGLYFDQRQIPNNEVFFAAPETGVEYTGDEIGNFVSNLLRERNLALIQLSPGHQTITNFNDAVSAARTVDEAELASAPGNEFVNYVQRLNYVDSNFLAGALRGLMRAPSYITPAQGAVMIAGRAVDVRMYARAATQLDRPRGDDLVLKRHEVADGTDPAMVLNAVRQIMPPPVEGKPGMGPVTNATFAVANKGLLVRGTAADHKLVDEIISQFNGK